MIQNECCKWTQEVRADTRFCLSWKWRTAWISLDNLFFHSETSSIKFSWVGCLCGNCSAVHKFVNVFLNWCYFGGCFFFFAFSSYQMLVGKTWGRSISGWKFSASGSSVISNVWAGPLYNRSFAEAASEVSISIPLLSPEYSLLSFKLLLECVLGKEHIALKIIKNENIYTYTFVSYIFHRWHDFETQIPLIPFVCFHLKNVVLAFRINSSNILVAAACSWWVSGDPWWRSSLWPPIGSRPWCLQSFRAPPQKASSPMTLMQVSKWKKLELLCFFPYSFLQRDR